MVKQLKFRISSEGEVEVTVEGVTGKDCEAFSAPFESLLGPVVQRQFKDSYYQTANSETEAEVDQTSGTEP